ncbi:MAG: RNA polymerase sigma factor [Rikenellaceae bacterium]|nr:RNA polymerase sigma factor [Rikenellaceae bacterium]
MNHLMDDTIIQQVLDGDAEAFGVLVDRYSQRVFSWVVRVCGDREEAQEITQDAFMKAYTHLSRFEGKSGFSSWLYRIAYNTAVSYLRKRKRNRFVPLDRSDRKSPEAVAGGSGYSDSETGKKEIQLERLEQALARLTPEERALLVLFYTEEKSIRQMALILAVSEGNVKIRLHRTRKKLAEIFHKIPVFPDKE